MIKVVINSNNGLHARPASKIVHACQSFESEILIINEEQEANARSIMNLLGIGIKYGDEVIVKAEGIDAQAAEAKIAEILGECHD